MQVLPVLDILHGNVVRGVAGNRENYRPIISQLTFQCDPLSVADAIRSEFGLDHIYVADLDGIMHQRPNLKLYRRLIDHGFRLLIDAGIRSLADASLVRSVSHDVEVVVGLETCRSPDDLREMAARISDATFSLDLQSGQLRLSPDCRGWSPHLQEIVGQVVESNIHSILVLDLADVGMGTGGSTDSVCHSIRSEFPSVNLIAGGGVRNREDLRRICAQRVDAVLVASALHDGRLKREDVHSF